MRGAGAERPAAAAAGVRGPSRLTEEPQQRQPPPPTRAERISDSSAGDAAAGRPPLPPGAAAAAAAAGAAGGGEQGGMSLADIVAASKDYEGNVKGKAAELAGVLLKVCCIKAMLLFHWCLICAHGKAISPLQFIHAQQFCLPCSFNTTPAWPACICGC